ncbi:MULTISPECIES: lysoplasmalogenase family protein [unclassified Fibrobacter]|uniref:lysoplasmalogenase family protein n=1 Tax=unclassified Fibrobacter TaxID=2634177 RepID=UPI000924043A|nr:MULTISPECIES: lysoplasmalogenase family protein [unclassified Fibrobacter]SHK98372.1 YhhN-like protein [Fibrobacter sp. UWB12]SIO41373.1 YhhN-like protein [Fibrobacter sp. UWB11]
MVYSKIVSILVAIAAVLFVAFFGRDWYVLYQCGAVQSCLDSSSDFQNITKFIVTAIATLIAFMIGRHAISRRDRFFVQASFALILCADFCFKILYNYFGSADNRENFITIGIVFFFLSQMIFIYRHTRTSDSDWTFPWIYCIPLAAIFSMVFLAYFHVLDSLMLMAVLVYAPTLSCSLFAACRASKQKLFPKGSAFRIMLGMICFVCCDLLTGISLLTGADHSTREILAVVSNNFIWLFYVPAIIFLALSGYRRNV